MERLEVVLPHLSSLYDHVRITVHCRPTIDGCATSGVETVFFGKVLVPDGHLKIRPNRGMLVIRKSSFNLQIIDLVFLLNRQGARAIRWRSNTSKLGEGGEGGGEGAWIGFLIEEWK